MKHYPSHQTCIPVIKLFALIFLIAFSAWSCHNNDEETPSSPATSLCDFSSGTGGVARCFGGIGPQCGGVPFVVPFTRDETTCFVDGWMAVGSILHDRCCAAHPEGYWCGGDTTLTATICAEEYALAEEDVSCGRIWSYRFGPYPVGNLGDDINQSFQVAPSGALVPVGYENFCASGKCDMLSDTSSDCQHGFCRCQ